MGLESVEHGELLLQLGCEVVQGDFIARPMPADDVPGWVAGFVAPDQWMAPAPTGDEVVYGFPPM